MPSFEDWYNALGPVTRAALVMTVGLTVCSTFGVVSPMYLVLTPDAVFKLQVWRFVTSAFFMGDLSLQWIMSMGVLMTYFKYNEDREFKFRGADFAWAVILLVAALGACGLALGLPVTSFALTMALCWVFCKRNPAEQLSLFGFDFRAPLFPWVLMAFHFILGGGLIQDACGVAVGHLYVFLQDVLPASHGVRLLPGTPAWLRARLPEREVQGTGFYAQPAHHPNDPRFAPKPARVPSSWGQGHRLGS